MAASAEQPIVHVRLRGHHLLCIFGFRGMGYDPVHAAGMAAVIRRLRAPDARVRLVAGPDDICAACPHRADARCLATDHARDMAVLAATGLTIGHDITVDALVKAVGAGVTLARQAALCAGCAWYDLGVCARGLAAGCVAAGWEEEARDATARSGAGREHSDGK